jgi:hypothetical protein
MPNDDPQRWFDTAPECQRSILEGLRKLILSAAPEIVEEIKWGRPCYSTANSRFCYLHRAKSHVTLGFQNGASLRDPKNLLEGEGKGMRHGKVTDSGMDQAAMLRLIKQAVKLT